MLHKSLLNKNNIVVRNVIRVLSGDIISRVIALGSVFLLTQHLTVKEFGEYNYLFSVLSLTTIISVTFLSAYLQDYKQLKYNFFDGGIILIPIFLTPLFIFLLKTFFFIDLNLLAAIIFCSNFITLNFIKTYLNVTERYHSYSLVNIFQQLSIIITVIFFTIFLDSHDVTLILKLNYLIAFIITISFFVLFVFKRKDFIFSFKIINKLKFIWNSKFYILYFSVLSIVNFTDLYFVKNMLDEISLGYYSFSLKMFNISLVALGPILTVVRIKQIDVINEKKPIQFFKNNFKKIFLMSVFHTIIFLTFSFVLIKFYFTQYNNSFISIVIFAACSFISYITIPFSFLLAMRKYFLIFIIVTISLLINILLNIKFIPIYGINGAAFSTLFTHFFLNTSNVIISYNYNKKGNYK